MKKAVITFLIIIFSAVPAISAEPVEQIFEELSGENFFQAPMPEVIQEHSEPKEKYSSHMPFFKKTRLKIKEFLNNKNTVEQKVQPKEEVTQDIDVTTTEEVTEDADVTNDAEPLVGEVREQVAENEMMLDCDNVVLNKETGDIEALGHPILILPPQNIELTADKMTYNQDSNILKAIGNVVLTKDGVPVYGDFIQINMNEENIFMDNISSQMPSLKISAKNAVHENDKIILQNGKMFSDKSQKYRFVSRMIGPDFSQMIVDDKDKMLLTSGETAKLNISASKIFVNAFKDHDTIQFKDAEIYYNNRYLFTIPSFTAHTNKEREIFEANYPEFGSRSKLGMFAGPGFVFDAPFGSILKVIPLLNYKEKFGFGGALKYQTAFNETYFMYGSSQDVFVLKGKQQLDDKLFLQYGSNAYMDDWFMGVRMPKYLAELIYQDSFLNKNFLTEGKDMTFKHRASVAFAEDGDWNMHTEHISSSGISTTRFKYMAEINQSLFKYKDEEHRKALDFGVVLQGSAAVYGTGDTQFTGRIGPRLHTQYKYWMQDLGYFATAYQDNTPLPIFDTYRYGTSSVYLREALRLNKYISVGWAGTITLSNDSPNGKPFQENMFIISLGPDDLKFNLGYDIMRKTTYFTVSMLFDPKGTTVEFDRMEIKNPEKFGKSDDKKDDVAFQKSDNSVVRKLQYAQVIDIEDPNKESI